MIKKFKVISHQEISLTEDIFDKIHSEILYKYPRVKQQFKKQDQLFSRGKPIFSSNRIMHSISLLFVLPRIFLRKNL